MEAATGGKWLSLLKEMAPGIIRAAFMFNPDTAPGGGKNFLASFEAAAGSLGIEPVAILVRSDAEIETGIAALGAEQAGLVEYSSFLAAHVETIISSTARYNVPAIYEATLFARKGGLIAYSASFTDMFRRAVVYVDRILRGERPATLPVQTQTKFEMIINLKTAKALGLNVPASLLATADEVIEIKERNSASGLKAKLPDIGRTSLLRSTPDLCRTSRDGRCRACQEQNWLINFTLPPGRAIR